MVNMQIGKAFVEVLDAKSYAAAVADEIVASIQEAVTEHGKCCVALAGGSTPSAAYRLLSRPPRVKEMPWKKTFLFWGDERWVPHESAHCNYHMTLETLLAGNDIPSGNVFAIDTSLSSPEAAAKSYAQTIAKTVQTDATGKPIFDLVILGMGDDGHTASLFPGYPALSADGTCVATDRPDGMQAVTLTKSVLIRARRAIIMVTGEGKAEILQQVLQQNMPYNKAPVSLVREMHGRVIWFLDTAAAKNLEKPQEVTPT